MSTRGALMSSDGLYRYRLWRGINPPPNLRGDRTVTFVMRNPSTADGQHDDATIRRCIGFGERHGYSELFVVNLFAYRTKDPVRLSEAREVGVNIVGPDNDTMIRRDVADAHLVIAAWGKPRWPWVQTRALEVATIIGEARARHGAAPLWAIGLTKDGHPRHPLYLPNSATATPFGVLREVRA